MQSGKGNRKKKSEERENNEFNLTIFKNVPSSTATVNPLPICDGDTCSLPSTSPLSSLMCEGDTCSMPSSSQSTMSEPMSFLEKEPIKETNSTKANESYISNETYALINSVLTGFISGASLTLLTELLEAFLKQTQYPPEQRYWITQFIRGLALIEMGSSPITAVSIPIINYLLNEYVGMTKENASYLTTGVAIGINVTTSPLGMVRASMAVSATICSSIAGSKLAKSAVNFAKQRFFSPKEEVAPSESLTEVATKRL